MLSVRMVELRLSAVTVVTICAPSTASSALAQDTTVRPDPARFAAHFAVASASMSYRRTVATPQISAKARHWNSACAPLPITAIVVAPGGARWRAASADIAAVRSAVSSVISDNNTG